MLYHFGTFGGVVSTATNQPRIAPSRTEQIVARVAEELDQRRATQHTAAAVSHQEQDRIINMALIEVRRHAESLNDQATLGLVVRLILAVTAHALGQLYYPVELLYGLEQFANEINTMVCSHDNSPR